MTVGSPPSITATTEFVVPRSMPMILPIPVVLLVCWFSTGGLFRSVGTVRRVVARCFRTAGGDCDHCRPQDSVSYPVAALDLGDHLSVGDSGRRHACDCLVLSGVERPAQRLD